MLLKKSGDKGVGTGIGNDENKIPPINDKKRFKSNKKKF